MLVAAAFASAADAAYDSVRDPAEGTMLTVIREMAHVVAQELAHMERPRLDLEASDEEQDALLAEVLDKATVAGKEAVERTPDQLDVLTKAGVVDAGAYGIVLILSGVVAGLRGEVDTLPELPHHEPVRTTRPHHEDSRFRYCTNFIVTGSGLEPRSYVPRLEEIGDSVLVVGDEATLKVHVHTDEPEDAVALFEEAGAVQRLDVADMREQIAAREERLGEPGRTGVVAVASGDGIKALYEELGAHVVDGGPTLNPSTYELLAGIHEVRAEEVLVLPNSANVVLAAERGIELSEKPVMVLGCTSPQAGLVALVELNARPSGRGQRRAAGHGSVRNAHGRNRPGRARRHRGPLRARRRRRVRRRRDRRLGRRGLDLAATIEGARRGRRDRHRDTRARAPRSRSTDIAGQVPEGVELELHSGGQPHWWWLLAAQ